jgi:hypothetical protein
LCAGKYYTVNVPLKDGMDDDNYKMLYEPIMAKVLSWTCQQQMHKLVGGYNSDVEPPGFDV